MVIGWLRNFKELEVKCTNKKCEHYKNRFIVKYDEKDSRNRAVNCPNCGTLIIISKTHFKRKNMKS